MDLLLKDYHPVSHLVAPEHPRPRAKFPVVDYHMHLLPGQMSMAELAAGMRAAGVLAGVNLAMSAANGGKTGAWDQAYADTLELTCDAPDTFLHFSSVDVEAVDAPDFAARSVAQVVDAYQMGSRGLKFYKQFGLSYRDRQGRLVEPDDPRYRPMFEAAGSLGMPVTIHVADPAAFFDPLDGSNERYEELSSHPGWSFVQHGPEGYRHLLRVQERMLAANPHTTFVIAHVASASEDLDYVRRLLDTYPNLYVDIAARISELGRRPYAARRFLIDYADRILFGTDNIMSGGEPYPYYFRFLETDDEYFPYAPTYGQGRWNIYGVSLPDEALKKIYYQNACRLAPALRELLPAGLD